MSLPNRLQTSNKQAIMKDAKAGIMPSKVDAGEAKTYISTLGLILDRRFGFGRRKNHLTLARVVLVVLHLYTTLSRNRYRSCSATARLGH